MVSAVISPVTDLAGRQAGAGVIRTGLSRGLADGGLTRVFIRVVFTVVVTITHPAFADTLPLGHNIQSNLLNQAVSLKLLFVVEHEDKSG